MFDRQEFKRLAKAQLKGHWTTPVLITLVTGIVLSIVIIPMALYYSAYEEVYNYQQAYENIENASLIPLIIFPIVILGTGVFVIAEAKYYLVFTARQGNAPFSVFLESFNLWWRGVLTYLWYYLWVSLWSCLFVIPGIVKALAYSQTFFIVAENPHISVRKAMRLSIAMTKGYKGDLFVLGLSFIGWALLSTLTLYIGFLWLSPYINATLVNTYRFLKQSAFDRGVLKPEDFGTASFTGTV